MPQFAANLSMMYPDMDFLDRFDAAAKDGFKAVEYLFPYAYAAEESWQHDLKATVFSKCYSTCRPAALTTLAL